VFLENVHATVSFEAGGLLNHILTAFRERSYNCRWMVLRGFNIGSPQHRPRFFLLASKTAVPWSSVTPCPMPTEWNGGVPPMESRLLPTEPTPVFDRLNMLGNCVVPQMANYAMLTLAQALPSRPRRKRDDEEREWIDPWEQRAAKRCIVQAYFRENLTRRKWF